MKPDLRPTVTLALLAGGASSRMGHPKTDLRIGDQPILEYLLSQWNWTGPTLLVTAPGREHPPAYDRFSREVSDPIPGEGPLRGIVTALESTADAEIVVIATCDMPLVTRAMLDRGVEALQADADALGVMTRRSDIIEPFPLALRCSALPILKQRLASSARSLHSLASLPEFRLVDAPADWPEQVWTNLNSPDDYKRFLATLQT